jgi:hypothetical protein
MKDKGFFLFGILLSLIFGATFVGGEIILHDVVRAALLASVLSGGVFVISLPFLQGFKRKQIMNQNNQGYVKELAVLREKLQKLPKNQLRDTLLSIQRKLIAALQDRSAVGLV